MNPEFWAGKRVFLTGHTGFKGSWLALWLTQLGAEVVGFALPPATSPSLAEALALDRHIFGSRHGDINDRGALESAVRQAAPEIVLHLAAQALVRPSYETPVETFSTNIMGTVHLLEAVRRTPSVRAVVLVSSDKCYENQEWAWGYREDDPLGGHDPYSASKGAMEIVSAAYRRSFLAERGVGVATARAGNVIGGGDWSVDRIVPDLARAFSSGATAVIRRPRAVRPWQHVLEPLAGYLLLAERLWQEPARFASAWNFGPDSRDTRTVRDLTTLFAAAWGDRGRWACDEEQASLHEATTLRLDSSRARAELSWRPHWTFEQAVAGTAAWYLSFYRDPRPAAVLQETVTMIHRYCTGNV